MSAPSPSRSERFQRSISVLLLGLSLVYFLMASRSTSPTSDRTPSSLHSLQSTEEVAFIFIASSTCAGVQDPGFPRMIDSARALARTTVSDRALTFASAAYVLDWDIAAGQRFLERFLPFDEVSIGRNWLNTGAVEYIWTDIPGEATIPQILILQRSITVTDRNIVVGPSKLLTRIIGVEEIRAWISAGATVPRSSQL